MRRTKCRGQERAQVLPWQGAPIEPNGAAAVGNSLGAPQKSETSCHQMMCPIHSALYIQEKGRHTSTQKPVHQSSQQQYSQQPQSRNNLNVHQVMNG